MENEGSEQLSHPFHRETGEIIDSRLFLWLWKEIAEKVFILIKKDSCTCCQGVSTLLRC